VVDAHQSAERHGRAQCGRFARDGTNISKRI
jgi:hypothetical protein